MKVEESSRLGLKAPVPRMQRRPGRVRVIPQRLERRPERQQQEQPELPEQLERLGLVLRLEREVEQAPGQVQAVVRGMEPEMVQGMVPAPVQEQEMVPAPVQEMETVLEVERERELEPVPAVERERELEPVPAVEREREQELEMEPAVEPEPEVVPAVEIQAVGLEVAPVRVKALPVLAGKMTRMGRMIRSISHQARRRPIQPMIILKISMTKLTNQKGPVAGGNTTMGVILQAASPS